MTSFEPYKEETSYENSLLVQHTGALALSSLVHVFRSLTPNARGIFILIAGHQLEEKDNNSYIGEKFVNSSLDREQYVIAIFFLNKKINKLQSLLIPKKIVPDYN